MNNITQICDNRNHTSIKKHLIIELMSALYESFDDFDSGGDNMYNQLEGEIDGMLQMQLYEQLDSLIENQL